MLPCLCKRSTTEIEAGALWIARRTLDERATRAHRPAERVRGRDQHWVDKSFTERARETEAEAGQIRELLRLRTVNLHTVPDDIGSTAGPGEPVAARKSRKANGASRALNAWRDAVSASAGARACRDTAGTAPAGWA